MAVAASVGLLVFDPPIGTLRLQHNRLLFQPATVVSKGTMLALLSWTWLVLVLNITLVRADSANDPHMKSIPVNIAN